jgi:type I restriction enzyme S subunit
MKYRKYKNSNLPWIKEIPDHWIISKLKHHSNVITGNTPSTANEDYFSDESGVPWVKPGDLSEFNKVSTSKQYLTPEGLKQSRIVRKGAVLIGGIGDIGKLGFAGCDLTTNQQIHSVEGISDKINDDYLKYLLYNSIDELQKNSSSVVLSILTKTKLLDLNIVAPPLEEQTQIARFLDHQTGVIDDLIKQKERLIELLKEKRQAVINTAVTKGLDPKVKMKESGIKWLNEIPAKWILKKLSYNTYMKGRIGWQGLKHEEFTEVGPYLITGMNFKDGVIRWDEVYHITQERYNEAPEIQLHIGDVLMTKDGTIGKLLFIDKLPAPASLNSHLLVLRPTDNSYLPKYFYYQLMSDWFLIHIELNKTGTTFYGITQEAVGRYKMLLPPIEEQQKIVDYIDHWLNKYENTKEQLFTQIEKLKEYRKSLISEAVTGKIDVRDWQLKKQAVA